MEERTEFEIDFLDLFYYLKKKALILVAALLAGAMLGAVYSSFIAEPQYTASTTVYMLNKNTEMIAYSDFQVSNQMVSDFVALVERRNVTSQVIEDLGLDISHSDLTDMIQVTAENNTRVLTIRVTDSDPQRAADIANKVTLYASQLVLSVTDQNAVRLVDEAVVPERPSSPNLLKNTVICGVLGAVLAAAVLVAIRLLDDTVRTEDDVERWLGLPTLGVIPMSRELETGTAKSAKASRKHTAQTANKE